jgi:glycosyltransferase involved in cell wall biosynthesis
MEEGISAVLIVKNEQKLLGRCLKSLIGFDEIIVLDTGSTDKTVQVARDHGAKVSVSEPIVPFHFAEARNRANALASNDWILVMDADEVLRPGAIRKIRLAMSNRPDATAMEVTFIDQPAGTKNRTVAIQKIKIFRRSAWSWRLRIHEQLFPTREPAVGIDLSSVTIEHLPDADKTVRHGQNIELLRLCIHENPEHARAFKHLGQELMMRKEWSDAIPYLAECVQKNQEGPLERSEVMVNLGRCYAETGRLQPEGLKWFDFAWEADQRRREPLYWAAWYLIAQAKIAGDLIKASEYLRRVIAIPEASRPMTHLDAPHVWGLEPRRMLSFCKEQIQQATPAPGH